ncbi:MAG TPA: TlpA disulfide reductase family protein [bacterium]|nr:TlpA disulfide reductase family protein [bacterium]
MHAPRDPGHPNRVPLLAVLAGGLLIAGGIALVLVPRLAPPLPRGGAGQAGDRLPPVGRPAPDFSLPLLSGGTLSLHNLRGKPVLLNFWASWCEPCREEMPLLVRLHRSYGPRGVEFVGIDTEDQLADARKFLGQYHVDYSIVRVASEQLMDAYSIPGLPTTVFIAPNGIVQGKVVGGFVGPDGQRALAGRLDRLLESARR